MSSSLTTVKATDLYKVAHDITIFTSSKSITIKNGIHVRISLDFNLKTSNSSFSLTVFNMSEANYEKIHTGDRIIIKLGYLFLLGGPEILNVKNRRVDTIFQGVVTDKTRSEEQGDTTTFLTGIDSTQRRLVEYTDKFTKKFSNTNVGGGTADVSEFVNSLLAQVEGIGIGRIDYTGSQILHEYTMEDENAFTCLKGLAKQYGMYFICKNNRVYFTREISGLQDSVSIPITVNYDNALLGFDDKEDDIIKDVSTERFVLTGRGKNLDVLGIARSTDKITLKTYSFRILGLPTLSVGNQINIQPNRGNPLNKVTRAVTNIINIPRRIKTTPLKLFTYRLKVEYSEIRGFTMSGTAVTEDRKAWAQKFIAPKGPEETADVIGELIDKKINTAHPFRIADVSFPHANEFEEIDQLRSKIVGSVRESPKKSVRANTEDGNYYNQIPYLTPFAGPSRGMILPQSLWSRHILANISLGSQDILSMGQLWLNKWVPPKHDLGDFLIQNARYTYTGPNSAVLSAIDNVTRLLIKENGLVGLNGKGLKIKIEPETGLAKFDISDSNGKVVIELGTTKVEVALSGDVTLQNGATTLSVKSTGVEIT